MSTTLTDWRTITSYKEKYAAYLCSREWSMKKRGVEQRCGGRCERCRTGDYECVHHLTYIRKYRERPEDLLGICNACHDFVHGKSDYDPAEPITFSAEPEAVARTPRLPEFDREILEILVGVPGGAALLIREMPMAELESEMARQVFGAAKLIHDQCGTVDIEGLLLAIPDPETQLVLVAVEETNRVRGHFDAGERLESMAKFLHRRAQVREAIVIAEALKTSRLDAAAEAELLERLVAQRRVAQGCLP